LQKVKDDAVSTAVAEVQALAMRGALGPRGNVGDPPITQTVQGIDGDDVYTIVTALTEIDSTETQGVLTSSGDF
jgi:hypothetical protein